jgi:hypothetical protein
MITAERVEQVTRVVERAGLNERTLSALREAFGEIHFTYCMDEDVGCGAGVGAPVREAEGFNLYLVDGRAHCMRFTSDLATATGLVLAETDHGS